MNTDNVNCPSCGERGKKVELKTVKSLLKGSLRKISPEKTYFFCKTENCPVVYYSDFLEKFEISDIRVPVFQKEPENPEVFVCYCFNYTVSEIEHFARVGREREIIEDINTGIKLKQCACEIRNPQGSCCLGNVYKVINSVKIKKEKVQ